MGNVAQIARPMPVGMAKCAQIRETFTLQPSFGQAVMPGATGQSSGAPERAPNFGGSAARAKTRKVPARRCLW
jgi:hypothetical protein